LLGKGGTLERAILAYRQVKRARIQREQEEARRRQEEAARKEAEALAKAEAAKTAKARTAALAQAEAASKAQAEAALEAPREMTRGTKTDSGSVSARERWVLLGITDMDLIPPSYWRDPIVVEALKRVLQRAITGGVREIPGTAIGIEEGLSRRVG
jgi:multidrug efflux pump subunit AcrA (membrane-fusion protein)